MTGMLSIRSPRHLGYAGSVHREKVAPRRRGSQPEILDGASEIVGGIDPRSHNH